MIKVALRLPRLLPLPSFRLAVSRQATTRAHAKLTSAISAAPSRRPPTDPRDLDSFQLAAQVKKLCTAANFDAATRLVQSSPGTTVVVWNVLLREVLLRAKWRLAWELWSDMKKRGIRPTPRSYATFFAGHARMADVADGVLGRVKTVFAQWLLYAESRFAQAASPALSPEFAKLLEDAGDDLSAIPTNAYLTFLANTKRYQLLLETFEGMPEHGPLRPTPETYTIILSALRVALRDGASVPLPSSQQPSTLSALPEHQSPPLLRPLFSTAMSVFDQLQRASGKPDTRDVSLVISICRDSPRAEDQAVGLTVARDLYGFVLEAENEDQLVLSSLPPPRVPLDPSALSNVLSLSLGLSKFNLTVRLFDQVRDNPERFGKDVLRHQHCDLVLVAHGFRKDSEAAEELLHWMQRSSSKHLKPTLLTWTNGFQACWREGNLARAYSLYSSMTGRPTKLVASSLPLANKPYADTSHPATTFEPDERIASTLVQTALATRNRAGIYRTLCLLEAETNFGQSYFAHRTTISAAKEELPAFRQHWQYRLSVAIEDAIVKLLEAEKSPLTHERTRDLQAWMDSARAWRRDKTNPGKEDSMRARRELVAKQGNSSYGNRDRRAGTPVTDRRSERRESVEIRRASQHGGQRGAAVPRSTRPWESRPPREVRERQEGQG